MSDCAVDWKIICSDVFFQWIHDLNSMLDSYDQCALIIRIKHAIQVMNPLKENIRTNYFPIHRAVTHFVPTIEEVIGGKILEDEIELKYSSQLKLDR